MSEQFLSSSLIRKVAFVHGTYFLITGIWPHVHMASFLWVSGPKADLWLVKTVGALVAVSGSIFLLSAINRRITFEILLLAVLSALSLALIDVYYALTGVISHIYLADAIAEATLIFAWLIAKKNDPKIYDKQKKP